MNRFLALALALLSPLTAHAMLRSAGNPAFVRPTGSPSLVLQERAADWERDRQRGRDEDWISNDVFEHAVTRQPAAQQQASVATSASTATTAVVPAAQAGSARAYLDGENEFGQNWFWRQLARYLNPLLSSGQGVVQLVQQYVSYTPPVLHMPLVAPPAPPQQRTLLTPRQLREAYLSHPNALFSQYIVGSIHDERIMARPEMRRLDEMGLLFRVWTSLNDFDMPSEHYMVLFMIDLGPQERSANGLLETEGDIEGHFVEVEEHVSNLLDLDSYLMDEVGNILDDAEELPPGLRRHLEHIEQTASERIAEWTLLADILSGVPQFGEDGEELGIQGSLLQAYQFAELLNWLSPRVFTSHTWPQLGLSEEDSNALTNAQEEIEETFWQIITLLERYLGPAPHWLGQAPGRVSAEVVSYQRGRESKIRKEKYQKKRQKQKEKKQRERAQQQSSQAASTATTASSQSSSSSSSSSIQYEAKGGQKVDKKEEKKTEKKRLDSSRRHQAGAGDGAGGGGDGAPATAVSRRPASTRVVLPRLAAGLEFVLGTEDQQALATLLARHENSAANLAIAALFAETPGSIALDAQRIHALAQTIGNLLVKLGISKAAIVKWLQTVKERCDHVPHRSGSGAQMLEHERDIGRGAFLESGVMPLSYAARGVVDDRSFRKLALKIARLTRMSRG